MEIAFIAMIAPAFSRICCKWKRGQRQPVYIGVDSDPAPRYETESWLAAQMGVEVKPCIEKVAERGAGHKRCRNNRLLDSGYQLRYPGYKQGYRAVLAARA